MVYLPVNERAEKFFEGAKYLLKINLVSYENYNPVEKFVY